MDLRYSYCSICKETYDNDDDGVFNKCEYCGRNFCVDDTCTTDNMIQLDKKYYCKDCAKRSNIDD